MSDKRISELTAATAAGASDQLPLVQSGTTKSITVSALVLEFDTVAGSASTALRAAPTPSTARTARVRGYYAAGDGGGGEFYWDSTSSASDNGGTVILPTGHSGAGRWLRIYSGALNVKWFGAKGDGTTDDKTAIEAAITAASEGQVVQFDGTHVVSATLTVTKGVFLDLREATLKPSGDFVVLQLDRDGTSDWVGIIGSPHVFSVNATGITHTSDGVVVKTRLVTSGIFSVKGAGRHGVYFKWDDANDNCNFSRADLVVSTCGSDGVRIEDTTGSGATQNLNAMDINIVKVSSCAVGVRQTDGQGNRIRIGADSNTGAAYIASDRATNCHVDIYDDSSNGGDISLGSGTSGIITGYVGNTVPSNSDWLVIQGGEYSQPVVGFAAPQTWRNSSATSGSGSARGLDLIAEGGSQTLGKFRFKGDQSLDIYAGTTLVGGLGSNRLELEAAISLRTKALSPAQITADQNDYNPGSGSYWRLNSDASRTITGINGGSDGRRLVIVNVGSFDIVLANQNGSSGASRRIITGTGASITLAADDTAELIYDGTTARWRVLNTH